MNVRAAMSTLSSPAARQAAARWLLVACIAGYGVTLVIMAARGSGLQRWVFALLVWALFVYVPLRILLEAFQTIAPAMRRTLTAQTAGRADRYDSRGSIEVMVDALYDRAVTMPRIATPVQGVRAKAGAVAVLLRADRPPAASGAVSVTRCLAAVDAWVRDLAGAAGREGLGNIQARWAGVRALIALAALVKILVAAAADRGVRPFAADLDARPADEYLDACLDYCDDLALQVDVEPWTEPPLRLDVPARVVTAVRDAWGAYCEIDPPAVDARTAFADAVTEPLGSPGH